MFFCRNDQPLLKRAKRRIASVRAAVFLEFAMLAPVLMLLISAMIEMAAFWDSRVLATHAAWQIGRIASVRAYENQTESNSTQLHGLTFGESYKNSVADVTTPAFSGPLKTALGSLSTSGLKGYGDVAALYLMCTSGIWAFGSTAQKAVASDLQDIFVEQGSMLAKEISNFVKDQSSSLLSYIPDDPSWDPIGLVSLVKSLLESFMNTLQTKIIDPILNAIGGLIDKFLNVIFGVEASAKDMAVWNRMAVRMGQAAVRVNRPEYKLEYKIADPLNARHNDTMGVWSRAFQDSAKPVKGKTFAYPETARRDDKRTDGWLDNPNPWPLERQKQSLITVTLHWPFSGSWIWPVVSGFGRQAGSSVTTQGNSIVYPQPLIYNENLYSKGSTEFLQGATKPRVELGQMGIGEYIKMMLFSIDYRMRQEWIWRDESKKHNSGGWTSYTCSPLEQILGKDDITGNHIEAKCYRRTIRTIYAGFNVDEKGDEWDHDFSQYYDPDMSYSITKKDSFYYRFQCDWHSEYPKYWAFRDYLWWISENHVRHRYTGFETCRDHRDTGYEYQSGGSSYHCAKLNKANTKKGETQYWWGNGGDDSSLFFDSYSRMEGEKKNYAAPHGQLERAYGAFETDLTSAANGDPAGGIALELNNIQDQALANLFKSTFRLNNDTCMRVYLPANFVAGHQDHAKKWRRAADATMSFARLSAVDFAMGMHEKRSKLYAIAGGSMEETEDAFTQDALDFMNDDKQSLEDLAKYWDTLRPQIDALYEKVDNGTRALDSACAQLRNAVHNFGKKMDLNSGAISDYLKLYQQYISTDDVGRRWFNITWSPLLRRHVQDAGNCFLAKLQNNLQSAFNTIQGWKDRPGKAADLEAKVRDLLHCTPYYSGGWKASGNADACDWFLNWQQFIDASNNAMNQLNNQLANERDWAAKVGVNSTHGTIPLNPDDLGDGEDPEAPPSGGDPTVSGSDDIEGKIGTRWELKTRGWGKK